MRKPPRTLRACGFDQRMQPPSPCRRGSSRSASRQLRRLTGLSAANDITRCYPQAPACPARRAAPAALKTPRPRNPRYVQLAASASLRLLMRRAPGAAGPGNPCALRFLRAIHACLATWELAGCARADTLASVNARAARRFLGVLDLQMSLKEANSAEKPIDFKQSRKDTCVSPIDLLGRLNKSAVSRGSQGCPVFTASCLSRWRDRA